MPAEERDFEKFTLTPVPPEGYTGEPEPSVILEGFEIPDSFPLGGDQRAIVTEFIGTNRREIHLLGAQPRQLEWEGKFYYDSALDRAKYIDSFRINGNVLDVLWGDYKFKAVIDKFYYDAASRFEVEYQIRLQIIAQDFDVYSFQVRESLDTVDRGILDIVEKIQDVLSIITRAIAIVDAIRRGDVNSLIGAMANILNILGTVAGGNLITINKDSIFSLTPSEISKIILFANSAAQVAKDLAYRLEQYSIHDGDSLATANPTAEAINLSSSFTLLATLVARLLQATPASSTTVVNTNLFALARQHYGDLAAWEVLATENNLNSTLIEGAKTLQLPPFKGKAPRNIPPSEVYDRNLLAITAAESKS